MVEKVKTENDSIWADMAEEHVPYWSWVLVIYELGSLTRDEVIGVSYHHSLPQQSRYSNGIFWACF
jgi:hypothetical protein